MAQGSGRGSRRHEKLRLLDILQRTWNWFPGKREYDGRSAANCTSPSANEVSPERRLLHRFRGGHRRGASGDAWQPPQYGGSDLAVCHGVDWHEPVPRADRGADVDAEVSEHFVNVVQRERDDLPAVAMVSVGGLVHERQLVGDLLAHRRRFG